MDQTQHSRLKERFMSKVMFTDSCWIWGGRLRGGKHKPYGDIMCFGKHHFHAHRLSWVLFKGELKDGLVIDHICRVKCCVNPSHLELVTNRENILRGIGLSAQNARKTECKRGHPLSGSNLRTGKAGNRWCHACAMLLQRIKRKGLVSF